MLYLRIIQHIIKDRWQIKNIEEEFLEFQKLLAKEDRKIHEVKFDTTAGHSFAVVTVFITYY